MKKKDTGESLTVVQNTLELWLSFKNFFVKAFTDEPVSTDEETSFLEVKSAVARNARALGERLNDKDFPYGGDKIGLMLRQCVSASHLRALPLADRKNLYKEWHNAFILLSRTVGALKFIEEGYDYVPPTRASGGSIASIKAAASDKAGKKGGGKGKAGGGGKKVLMVVVFLVAAAGGFILVKMFM